MCLLSMLSMTMMLAISQVEVQGPPLEFESHDSLEVWAETSTFGGGRLYRLGPEALGLYCADRSYTSGVYSSELALYAQADDSYKLVLYLPLKRFVLIHIFIFSRKQKTKPENLANRKLGLRS